MTTKIYVAKKPTIKGEYDSTNLSMNYRIVYGYRKQADEHTTFWYSGDEPANETMDKRSFVLHCDSVFCSSFP